MAVCPLPSAASLRLPTPFTAMRHIRKSGRHLLDSATAGLDAPQRITLTGRRPDDD
jgi:hypothetical protein